MLELEKKIAEVNPEVVADGDETFTLHELYSIIEKEGEKDPNELIKNRFLCRTGAAILAAQTGCGKSSFIMQMIFNFALGRSCFGLTPTQPLKTLLIQAENDKRDLYEEVAGVCRGLLAHEHLAYPELERAKQAITVRTCTQFTGDNFINHLEDILSNSEKFDLLVIDPLFSFIGVDISKEQGHISKWLRNGLNTILKKYNIGTFIVHHANKPSKATTTKDINFNSSYDYAGSSELANWTRAMLVLERFNVENDKPYFRLSAPKRGERIKQSFCKYLKWAEDGGIYWYETQPPTIPVNKVEQKEIEREKKLLEQAKKAASLLKPGEVISKENFNLRISANFISSSRETMQKIIAVCIGKGFIIERKRNKDEPLGRGVSKVVHLPETHSNQEKDELFQN